MDKDFFKVGNVVLLKGNYRPAMTVASLRPAGLLDGEHVLCKWFDGHVLYTGVFHQESLLIKPEDKF